MSLCKFTRRSAQAFAMHASGDHRRASPGNRSGAITKSRMVMPLRLSYEVSTHPARLLPAQMAVAIEEPNNRLRLSPINDADGSGIEKNAEGGRDGRAKRGAQYSLDWSYMGYEDNGLIGVRRCQLFDDRRYALMYSIQALAAGRGKSSIALPGEQMLGILLATRHQLAPAQSFPCPKVFLAQLIQHLHGQIVAAGDGQGCLKG